MPENREELMRYRLDMAKERLESSKVLLAHNSYKDSIGRSYYAMFTAVRALLAMEGVDFSKHAGVIAYFQKEYIKKGIFDKKFSKYLSQAFQIRNNTDYADFFLVSKEDAEEQYKNASEFYMVICEYLLKSTDGDVENENPAVHAMKNFQEQMNGEAEKAGFVHMELWKVPE